MKRICVFCGSSIGAAPRFVEAARALGDALVARRYGLVYGGASVGLMGAIADAVLAGGGEVIGVIPRSLARQEIAHHGLSDLHVVSSMHERKAVMAEHADAFIALPGGLGTLEEFFEVLTWAQLGIHTKPVALLDVDGYYEPLLGFLDGAVRHGFVRPPHRDLIHTGASAEELLHALEQHRPAAVVEKWFDRDRA